MDGIGFRDFEYYEEKASYLDYTHDPEESDDELICEYFELDPEVIRRVEEIGRQDRTENRKMRNMEQLGQYNVYFS